MAPSDILGVESLGEVRPVIYPGAPLAATNFATETARVVSPLDENPDGSDTPADAPLPRLDPFYTTTFDDPTFGKVVFAAGAGAVLIDVQAAASLSDPTTLAPLDPVRVTGIYAINQSLMGAPVATTHTLPEAPTVDAAPRGFWWPAARDPLQQAA